jgi:phage FluMu protein Com
VVTCPSCHSIAHVTVTVTNTTTWRLSHWRGVVPVINTDTQGPTTRTVTTSCTRCGVLLQEGRNVDFQSGRERLDLHLRKEGKKA